ncbi:hypothetical protein Ancab_006922 [Ancistrocladus abbreviatus]
MANTHTTMAMAQKMVERHRKEKIFVGWRRPQDEWVKVNTDGVVHARERAGARGLVRNDEGHWPSGFAVALGVYSMPTDGCSLETWGLSTLNLKLTQNRWLIWFVKD